MCTLSPMQSPGERVRYLSRGASGLSDCRPEAVDGRPKGEATQCDSQWPPSGVGGPPRNCNCSVFLQEAAFAGVPMTLPVRVDGGEREKKQRRRRQDRARAGQGGRFGRGGRGRGFALQFRFPLAIRMTPLNRTHRVPRVWLSCGDRRSIHEQLILLHYVQITPVCRSERHLQRSVENALTYVNRVSAPVARQITHRRLDPSWSFCHLDRLQRRPRCLPMNSLPLIVAGWLCCPAWKPWQLQMLNFCLCAPDCFSRPSDPVSRNYLSTV
jgi:hypothetical protein